MLALILAATIAANPGGADVSDRCAEALAALARAGTVEATSKGNAVNVAGTPLQLRARVEEERQAGPQWVAGIAVQVAVRGNASALVEGAVGVGATRADAVDTAILEWANLAGVALIRAVAVRGRSKEVFSVGRVGVYPGFAGIRGAQGLSWSLASNRQLVTLMAPALSGLAPGQLHGLSVSILVDSKGPVRGECRLDGVASPAAFASAQRYPWPRSKETYMLRQYYVLQPGSKAPPKPGS
jgi:hypothetical protein